jgi:hypothetical protein
MSIHRIFNLVIAVGFAFLLWGMPVSVLAQEPQPINYIWASPSNHFVYAFDWPNGTAVHMTVARSGSTIYTSDATVEPGPGNGSMPVHPPDIVANFDLSNPRFDLQPGDVITMTGGGITRSMTVWALQVTGANASTGTVTGTAAIGTDVNVGACGGGAQHLTVTPDSSGHWTANFAPFDILPGCYLGTIQFDGNGNVIQQAWRMPRPVIEAAPNLIRASDWPLGANITMTFDDPSNGVGIDYSAQAIMMLNDPNYPDIPIANFDWPNSFPPGAGYTITMTDGVTSKTYVVKQLQVTTIDLQADTIAGIANPGAANILVGAKDANNFIVRHVTADSSGNWLADYHTPGTQQDEQLTVDLKAGSYFWVTEFDPDGNFIWADWNVPQQLNTLEPAKVWVGLQNSQDKGIKFDLKAEAYKDGVLITSGESDSVDSGGAEFNNANLDTINFNSFSPIDFPAGSQLSIKLYVRNSCSGSKNNGKTARLWYNDSGANSGFRVIIDSVATNYYLVNDASLSTNVGSGPKLTKDVDTKTKCAPFSPFGTWAITP